MVIQNVFEISRNKQTSWIIKHILPIILLTTHVNYTQLGHLLGRGVGDEDNKQKSPNLYL